MYKDNVILPREGFSCLEPNALRSGEERPCVFFLCITLPTLNPRFSLAAVCVAEANCIVSHLKGVGYRKEEKEGFENAQT